MSVLYYEATRGLISKNGGGVLVHPSPSRIASMFIDRTSILYRVGGVFVRSAVGIL